MVQNLKTVAFSCTSSLLCPKQTNMTDQFTTIATFLSDADPADLVSMTFNDLCRRHGASPRCMNNIFYDHFGMSGDEVIAQLVSC